MRATLCRNIMNDSPEFPVVEHQPVMVEEVLNLLRCRPGGVYVDATTGLGGHAQAILDRIRPGGLLVGVDRDKESLERARFRLKDYSDCLRLVHDNFKNISLILNNVAIGPVDGILVDLGVSSFQLLSSDRGFSFQGEGMLDMRMDRSQRYTAADLVNSLPEGQLADIIYRYGEERLSRRIAAAIVRERERAPITKCSQLAGIISRTLKARGREHLHPATKTFQALRIAVNQELEGLEEFFDEALSFLRPGGRIVAIAFHSLEDRIVKRGFRRLSGQCVCERPPDLCICPKKAMARLLTNRPVVPGPEELANNARARSARLRAIERI